MLFGSTANLSIVCSNSLWLSVRVRCQSPVSSVFLAILANGYDWWAPETGRKLKCAWPYDLNSGSKSIKFFFTVLSSSCDLQFLPSPPLNSVGANEKIVNVDDTRSSSHTCAPNTRLYRRNNRLLCTVSTDLHTLPRRKHRRNLLGCACR